MVGGNFWNFWWGFSMFWEKLQNVCYVANNPDQLKKTNAIFGFNAPQTPKSATNFKSSKILYTSVILRFLLSKMLKPLLGCTWSWDRCWAAILLSQRPEKTGQAVHGEVDGLVIGGQHGRRFVLLRHTHRPQRRPYLIYTSRSGNVRHRCGGG